MFSSAGFSGPGSELTSLNGSNISSGTVPYARLPVGTGSSQVAQGSHTHSNATTSAAGFMSADDKTKLNGIAAGAQANTITGVKGNSESSYRTGNVNITAANIGLGNVDNTSDANKPVSTATQTALNGKVSTSLLGAASGVATLDSGGKVPTSQLPSYVDDVLEYSAQSSFPSTGETGKIYVDTATNKTYRWSGSAYVEISASLALGTTSSTAYRGDYGNTAYSHATDSSRLTTAKSSGLYKIATTAQGHVASVTAVTKADITGLGIPDASYSSKAAASGGTDVSLVTTGEKYTWNNKSNLALGTTSSTAYRGDYGNAAYAHGVTNKGSAFSSGLYKITTNSEGHVTAATAVTKADITGLGIPSSDTNTWRPVGTGATDAAAGNHTHSTSIATSSSTNQLTLAASTKYAITAGGTSYVFTTPPNTTYSNATQSAAGLMSAADKTKLDNVASGNEVVISSIEPTDSGTKIWIKI